jgi:hypothetical protein
MAGHGKIVHQMIGPAHARRKGDARAASISINVVARGNNEAALCHITSISSTLDIVWRVHQKAHAINARKVAASTVNVSTRLVSHTAW